MSSARLLNLFAHTVVLMRLRFIMIVEWGFSLTDAFNALSAEARLTKISYVCFVKRAYRPEFVLKTVNVFKLLSNFFLKECNKELGPRSIKIWLKFFTKLKFETIQIVITYNVGDSILLLCLWNFFTSVPTFSTCASLNIPWSLKKTEN